MPSFAAARYAEMIKITHMQTDSTDQGLVSLVHVHRAVTFEQTHFF